MSAIVPLLMLFACLGYGAILLRMVGPCHRTDVETWALAGALGYGVLGWLAMPVFAVFGVKPILMTGLVGLGLPGLLLLPRPSMPDQCRWWPLWGGVAVILAAGILAGLVPPVDADSLAYHFALPKQFLTQGALFFTPRAVDGAVPMLQHMNILIALGLGGEQAMTLWCAISGWMVIPVMFACGRRFLPTGWALTFALLVQTVPAFTYGAVTGQVEVRLLLSTLPAMLLAADAARAHGGGALRLAVLAGLLAGLYPAAKYPGLLFAFSVAVVILPFNWRAAVVVAVAAGLSGGQWYLWNWWQSGDPVFPMLAGVLPLRPGIAWDAEQSRILSQTWSSTEMALPRSLWWMLAYPVYAQVVDHPVFEAGRTGFGPFALLAVPMALAGLWSRRASLARHPLGLVLAMAALTYGLWFWLGPSQRLRHLLPLLPAIFLALLVAARAGVQALPELRRPLLAVMAFSLALQFAALGLSTAKYGRYVVSGRDAESWREHNIFGYRAARWINGHLKSTDGVGHVIRQTAYALDVPSYLIHSMYQMAVPLRPSTSVDEFAQALAAAGLNHVMLPLSPGLNELEPESGDLHRLVHGLEQRDCARRVTSIDDVVTASRTLPGLGAVPAKVVVYRITCDQAMLGSASGRAAATAEMPLDGRNQEKIR